MYTLTLLQSRKSPGRLPSIPLVLPRQPVSRRGLSSAQLRAGPKARLDHSGDFGSTLKWRSYRSSWAARSSWQVPARHTACQNRCWSHCRWLAADRTQLIAFYREILPLCGYVCISANRCTCSQEKAAIQNIRGKYWKFSCKNFRQWNVIQIICNSKNSYMNHIKSVAIEIWSEWKQEKK